MHAKPAETARVKLIYLSNNECAENLLSNFVESNQIWIVITLLYSLFIKSIGIIISKFVFQCVFLYV